VSSIYVWSENSSPKRECKVAKIEERLVSSSPFLLFWSCLLRRPSLCHGKVTISRGPAESCKMNKCCSKPASLKKAVLFVQRWCAQQTLSLKMLPSTSLESPFYFTSFTPLFIACLYSRLCINLLADVTPAPFFYKIPQALARS
jgi:hypothetical protein